MSRFCKFGSHLRELRLHLCQTSKASCGARDFITENYVALKTANPQLPILIRECSGVQPRLWARFSCGNEASASLTNLSTTDIGIILEKLVKG